MTEGKWKIAGDHISHGSRSLDELHRGTEIRGYHWCGAYGVDRSGRAQTSSRILISKQVIRKGAARHVFMHGSDLGLNGCDTFAETDTRRVEAYIRIATTPSCLAASPAWLPRPWLHVPSGA